MNNYTEEYITKETVQKVIKNIFSIHAISNKCLPSEEIIDIYIKCMEAIKDTPSSNVRENIKAVWIERELQSLFGSRHTETRCGNCGYEVYKKTPFCPNCGADIREVNHG